MRRSRARLVTAIEKLQKIFYSVFINHNFRLRVWFSPRIFYTRRAREIITIILELRVLLQPKEISGRLNAEGFRFGIISARWNDLITGRLVEGALDALERTGATEENVAHYRVPGSFEVPLLAQKLAESGKFDVLICLSTVIRGETPHFDYVVGGITNGIATAMMKTGVPIIYGVVTAETVEQALNRAGIKAGNKGYDAAMVAVEMANLYSEIKARG